MKIRGVSHFAIWAMALSFSVTIGPSVSSAQAARTCAEGGACIVGDLGPGGGMVFYVDSDGFTVAGTDCAATCQYLEYAHANWNGGTTYPRFIWSSDVTHQTLQVDNTSNDGTGNQALGMGYSNTQEMLTSRISTGYVADTSGAAFKASTYAATDQSSGKWFLPSSGELQTLYDSTAFATFENLDYAYMSSSSERDSINAYIVCFSTCSYAGLQNRESRAFDKNNAGVVVPIRAFKSLTEQNITFPEVKAAVVGSTSISVNATASSGLNVSYRSNDHTICTVFEGYWNGPPQPAPVTLLAVGTCSITAIQEGDNTYAPAADVTRTFKVTAAVKNNTDAASAAEAQRQRELRELLSVIPTIAGLALNIGALTNELLGVPKSSSTKQKCVKGTKSKYIKKGAKCPAGYKKIK